MRNQCLKQINIEICDQYVYMEVCKKIEMFEK